VNGVEALAEERLPFGRVADFAGFGRIGEEVKGFDEFFVEVDEFVSATLFLAETAADDRGHAIKADGAAFEIVAVDVAKDVFSELNCDRILFGRGIHNATFRLNLIKMRPKRIEGEHWNFFRSSPY
jgi:hypothetical protein